MAQARPGSRAASNRPATRCSFAARGWPSHLTSAGWISPPAPGRGHPRQGHLPYQSERRWIAGEDGVKVPVSLVWRKGITHPRALLLYGYGAYGTPMRPYYQPGC